MAGGRSMQALQRGASGARGAVRRAEPKPDARPGPLHRQERRRTRRAFTIVKPRLPTEELTRPPYMPFSFARRFGPDKGFFHRDNFQFTAAASNPWGFLFPGGKAMSPMWQSDPGIGTYEKVSCFDERKLDDAAYRAKFAHNHPETGFDLEPTPFGCYDFDFSKRSGIIGVKVGKVTQVDDYGNMHNAQVVWIPEQHVLTHRTREADGFCSLRIGALDSEPKNTRHRSNHSVKAMREMCLEAGLPPKRVCKEFRITEDAYIPVGTKLDVRHFVPGQLVTTRSRTMERGLQGVVARWGFKGGPSIHGPIRATAWHHRPGSINTGVSYGRVTKGKRMAGHMGGLLRQQSGNWVWRIDYKNQLIYILGNIAGGLGQFITIEDAHSRRFDFFFGAPPFPTFVPPEDEDLSKLSFDECQLISRSRIGYPKEMAGMPSPEVLDTVNFAEKQRQLMSTENIGGA
eukprot:TRINITY_DN66588_c0_g1_i1.p1 TRINITY_DN66588_c0_g1~~TRINITY_DN66588_c0_g1_i1.p1  ORF type:complete len:457 (+),score=91.58 TRINITY_DN66588_c0_g1_i1:117-1487(+)